MYQDPLEPLELHDSDMSEMQDGASGEDLFKPSRLLSSLMLARDSLEGKLEPKNSSHLSLDEGVVSLEEGVIRLEPAAETTDVNHAIELFSEVLAALGPDENIGDNEIIHELYEEMDNLRYKLKLLANNHKSDSKSIDGLLCLLRKIDDISLKYLDRMNDPFLLKSSDMSRTYAPQQTGLQHASISVSSHSSDSYDLFEDMSAHLPFHSSSLSKGMSADEDYDSEEDNLKRRNRPNWKMERISEILEATKFSPIRSDLSPAPAEENRPVPEAVAVTSSTTASDGFKVGYIVPEKPGSCPICCDDEVAPENLYIFGQCMHQYCKECLQGYYANKINENKITDIVCPFPACPTIIEYHQIQDVVDPVLFTKYEEFAFLASLNADPTVKWCPRVGCGNAIIGDPENPRSECTNPSCRFEFCFLCSEAWHPNATCEQYQEWRLENGLVDTKFEKWSKKNTKKCPKCRTLIEKMSGCNHMTCTACHYQFCWLCSGKYSSNHFDVFNVLGCPGMQSGSKTFGVAKRVGMRALIGTGLVLGGVVGVALVIPAVVVGGPIWGGIKIHQKRKAAARSKKFYRR